MDYTYDQIIEACRLGQYAHVKIYAASGRPNFLLGMTSEHVAALKNSSEFLGVELLMFGSRVSGPRVRQRTLHPTLRESLILTGTSRAPSALFSGFDTGHTLDKTVIRDHGMDHPLTSDLAVAVVGPGRSPEDLRAAAENLEKDHGALAGHFPLRFFSHHRGAYYLTEDGFVTATATSLMKSLPPGHAFSMTSMREGVRELYCRLGAIAA